MFLFFLGKHSGKSKIRFARLIFILPDTLLRLVFLNSIHYIQLFIMKMSPRFGNQSPDRAGGIKER